MRLPNKFFSLLMLLSGIAWAIMNTPMQDALVRGCTWAGLLRDFCTNTLSPWLESYAFVIPGLLFFGGLIWMFAPPIYHSLKKKSPVPVVIHESMRTAFISTGDGTKMTNSSIGGNWDVAIDNRGANAEYSNVQIGANGAPRISYLDFREAASKAGIDTSGESNNEVLGFVDAIREAAINDEFSTFGKEIRSSFDDLNRREPVKKIPPEHWDRYQIEWFSTNTDDNFDVITYRMDTREKGFCDLHIETKRGLTWLHDNVAKIKSRTRKV